MKISYADTGEPVKKADEEYLRRNLLHCASIGALASVETALTRFRQMKRKPPKWLIELLEGAVERSQRVSREMAAHRDEIEPYKD